MRLGSGCDLTGKGAGCDRKSHYGWYVYIIIDSFRQGRQVFYSAVGCVVEEDVYP